MAAGTVTATVTATVTGRAVRVPRTARAGGGEAA